MSRKSAVIASVTFVDALIDSCNTYKKVCFGPVRQELLKSVSDAIVDGITMFKSDGTVLSFQKVKEEAEVVPEYVYNSLNKALLSEDNSLAVSQESYSCLMGEYIRNRLAKIFNISLNDLPALRYGVEGGSGGMGDGNMNYGSDDEVYDHKLGQRVKYGEVINKHYTNILN